MEQKLMEMIPQYELILDEQLPDVHMEGMLLRHKKSGARVVLLPCEDDNKVFSIAFRTPPADSTGVAHIIEHTVLCGSEHFPLKDPFVELVKGSLNTFLNAMTYPDKTVYPVASTNKQDFLNLMHVYLDAVFHPNIYHEENIFRQEGWHYELKDTEGPLVINGVVYNEMKGAFSSADDVLERETMNALFPDTSYGVESGGDPNVIPQLTYEQYLDFHRQYYHPSNSYIFLYGDMDMAECLGFIDREYLSDYDLLAVDSSLKKQPAFEEERIVTRSYPIAPDEDPSGKTHLTWNAVCGDPLNVKEKIAFQVLDYALFSAPGAPVRQALLDAGVGMDVYGQYNDGILQPYFTVTAKNADEEDAERFRQIILDVLKEQSKKGISRKALHAGLNSLEFQFREADFAQYPKGLFYGLNIMDSWLYDDTKPFVDMKQLKAFEELRDEMETGYFENLIRSALLENTHRALVILKPVQGLQEQRDSELAEKLEKLRASLTEDARSKIVEETNALLAWQDTEETEEALASIPVLMREDIRKEIVQLSNIEDSVEVAGGDQGRHEIPVLFHYAPSNGIGYTELLFDALHLNEEDIPWLGLLKGMLFNLDTEHFSYMELNNEINSETGGISAGILVSETPGPEDDYKAYLLIRSKQLYAKTNRALELIKEALLTSRFEDRKRVKEIISQTVSQLQAVLMHAGNAAASLRAEAYFLPQSAFGDKTGGIAFYRFVKDLDEHFEERGAEISEKLKTLCAGLARLSGLTVSMTCEEEERDHFKNEFAAGFDGFPDAPCEQEPFILKPYGTLNEAFKTSGQVQFAAYAGDWRGSGASYNGAMMIYRSLMSYEYLWQNIRVRGGAYGCGASLKKCGSAVMVSYRDPHLKRTLDIYREIPDYLEHFAPDEKEMTKYVIGTISGIDTPLTPSVFGIVSLRNYLSGQTDEERQARRDEILCASADDLKALAGAVRKAFEQGGICVIGSEAMVEKHKELFDNVEQLL